MSIFYVYYSYEEWGRGYIGYHRCPKNKIPETDGYFGSYKDPTFKPTQKIILETYKTKEEAISAEILLHEYFQVDKNPHFANKAKQTSIKFSFRGVGTENPGYQYWKGNKRKESSVQKQKQTIQQNQKSGKYIRSSSTREKNSEVKRGKDVWNKGIPCAAQTKKKISDAQKNNKHYFYNKKLNVHEKNVTITYILRNYKYSTSRKELKKLINREIDITINGWTIFVDNSQPDGLSSYANTSGSTTRASIYAPHENL